MAPPKATSYDKQQDKKQATKDQQQDQQIQNLQSKLPGVESEIVQQGAQANTLQRLRIHIPNPYTHFLLGQRVTGNTPFGYTGASLQTDGNLVIDVKEDTVVQTQGFTLLQTNDLWQQYAASLMELSSPAAVKVVGGQVFLGAIDSVQAPVAKANNGKELTANTANDLGPAITHLTTVGSGWDIGLSVMSLVATGVFFSPLDTADTNSWIKTAETAWSTGKKLYDLGKKALAGHSPKKDVNVYGQDGVNVMSPKKISLTTEDSVKVFAKWGVTISSAASSTMMAVQGVKCFGGLKASLEGGAYADVKAGRELGVSCLRGKLKLKGKQIDIGSDKPKWTQLATEKLTLTATKKLQIDSKEIEIGLLERNGKTIVNNKITMTAKEKIHLDSKDAFEIKAKNVVQIQVGSYAIEIKTDAIKIGKGSDGKPSDPMITIKGQTITLDSSGMGVVVNKSSVTMGKSGNLVRVSGSGDINVKGKKVLLG
jgi:hypothetical protein